MDSCSHYNHTKISEQKINRQKLNNSLKRISIDDIFTKPFKFIRFEIQNADI